MIWKLEADGRTIIKIVGITGKIASGKSTVSRYLKKIKKNALLLDVDRIAKNIYKKNPDILEKLRHSFGERIFDSQNKLIFSNLGEIVFSDERELVKLNKLMFPLIRKEVENILSGNRKRDYIIIDAAVLFDSGLDDLCDFIIYVRSSIKHRMLFLKNKGLVDDEIKLKIRGQHITIDRGKVNFIIENDSSRERLLEKIEKVASEIGP